MILKDSELGAGQFIWRNTGTSEVFFGSKRSCEEDTTDSIM